LSTLRRGGKRGKQDEKHKDFEEEPDFHDGNAPYFF